jgi:hypothetical protein
VDSQQPHLPPNYISSSVPFLSFDASRSSSNIFFSSSSPQIPPASIKPFSLHTLPPSLPPYHQTASSSSLTSVSLQAKSPLSRSAVSLTEARRSVSTGTSTEKGSVARSQPFVSLPSDLERDQPLYDLVFSVHRVRSLRPREPQSSSTSSTSAPSIPPTLVRLSRFKATPSRSGKSRGVRIEQM